MRALVTGCAGFIGSNLARKLLQEGWEVVGLDNLDPYYDLGIKEHNLAQLSVLDGFEMIRGDLNDPQSLDSAFSQPPDVMVHLAARAGVVPSFQDPAGYARANIEGTISLFQAASRAGVDRVVFASSSSIYGETSSIPYREDEPRILPISPYGLTKHNCEGFCRLYWERYGLRCNALRFFTVYGPGQRPDMAVHRFIRNIRSGRPIELYGDGGTYRDYTHISDILEGVTAAMDDFDGFRIYNLGSGRPVTLGEVVETISEQLGREPQVINRPLPPGDMIRTYADISRARDDLGYSPKVDFQAGVASEIEWIAAMEQAGVLR